MPGRGSAPFQTIYVSIGSAQSARASSPSFLHAWAGRWVRLFEADLTAASIGTSGFLQIDLPAPVTVVSVIVNYASLLANSFDLQIQISGPGGAAGPIASVHKTGTGPGLIEIVGVVYGGKTINPSGPDSYVNPVSGATVSTSLDSRTAVTNGNGAFDLLTDTPNASGRCFRLTVTAGGYPGYSTDGWTGSNKDSGGIIFSLGTGEPRGPLNGRGC